METITIPLDEYRELQKDQYKLIALQEHGVDNWEGYDDAMDSYRFFIINEGLV